MLSTVNLVALQMTSGPSPDKNLKEVQRLLSLAPLQANSIVVLPECFSCFGCCDPQPIAYAEPEHGGEYTAQLFQLAESFKCHLFAGTMPMRRKVGDDKCYATCRYIDGVTQPKARQRAIYNKIHLFDVTVSDNTGKYKESATTHHGEDIVVVQIDHLKVGIAVCYDLRFSGLFDAMGDIDVLVLPSAFTVKTGEAHWHTLLRARAIEKQCYVVAANQVGLHENGRETYGHSVIISPWGDILDELPDGAGTVSATVDRNLIAQIKRSMPVINHAKFRSHLVQ
jgi:predicted amidohydrolase